MNRGIRIAVADETLADLRSRLRNTRWPEAELVGDWSQGAPLAWIREICRYWADVYDWRRREAALNRFTQFTTEIDGLDIHFIHVRSKHPNALPIIIDSPSTSYQSSWSAVRGATSTPSSPPEARARARAT